jgi:hypothetical protein
MASSMKEALAAAGERPVDTIEDQQPKRKYALKLSDELSKVVARDLAKRFRKRFKGIKSGESRAASKGGTKKLDVNYSTELRGLELGVSIKTISHRDKLGKGRYTKNRKRVDEEFLAEAMDYHVRQPYAVLVGLYFLPADGCLDAHKPHASSFGAWVEKLFARTGRVRPTDNAELFERILVGLFEQNGDVSFFDVMTPPPKQGPPPPDKLLTWEGMLDAIHEAYADRNAKFKWAEATAPLTEEEAEEEAVPEEEADDEDE